MSLHTPHKLACFNHGNTTAVVSQRGHTSYAPLQDTTAVEHSKTITQNVTITQDQSFHRQCHESVLCRDVIMSYNDQPSFSSFAHDNVRTKVLKYSDDVPS